MKLQGHFTMVRVPASAGPLLRDLHPPRRGAALVDCYPVCDTVTRPGTLVLLEFVIRVLEFPSP